MNSAYDLSRRLHELHDHACARYRAGVRTPEALFGPEDEAFLARLGSRPQDFLDYAEDFVTSGEPDFPTVFAVQTIRRNYFLQVQEGNPTGRVLDEASLPPKDATVRGIAWLPRLMPKARAKLRGELPLSLMYGCGGDRHFFRTHDLHPAEFLQLVWTAGDDDARIVDYVARRDRRAA